uniref:Uncharacterized protein AlNc14C8G1114 n=1 Tax=Albugo laibachii Nc14 TaxID=890382 RepID=F0W241_9STRA|nr:conserved hypothetical protein [Albugo laibachii Nc14]|eukprot:CCA15120.1 conserved hypothetical protein [Albugo laibachii Nc14]
MSVVPTLFRHLCVSASKLKDNLHTGESLYNAIRSAALSPHPSLQGDWKRERDLLQQLQALHKNNESFGKTVRRLVRSKFDTSKDTSLLMDQQTNERIDEAFSTLRSLGKHLATIKNLKTQEAYLPKKRTGEMKYRVGEVINVGSQGTGVVCAWTFTRRLRAKKSPEVVYHLLLNAKKSRIERGKFYRATQDELSNIEKRKVVSPVKHPWILFFFEGFKDGCHIPCLELKRIYPEDTIDSVNETPDQSSTSSVSIVHLQSAHENQLLEYLRSTDTSTVQYAMAILEGKWMGEYGSDIQQQVLYATQQLNAGDVYSARVMLKRITAQYPDYAYVWSKLGMVEVRDGNYKQAIVHYQCALKRKPYMVDALLGVGTCAAKLSRWNLAHESAAKVLSIQPSNETARCLLQTALYEALGGKGTSKKKQNK